MAVENRLDSLSIDDNDDDPDVMFSLVRKLPNKPAETLVPLTDETFVDTDPPPKETFSYPYQPISLPFQSRVLEIEEGSFGEELVCSLKNLDLTGEPDPSYDALSYCWASSHVGPRPVPVALVELPVSEKVVKNPDGSSTIESMKRTAQIPGLFPEHPYWRRNKPHHILCDGIAVSVGFELYTALQRIRREDRSRRLWVDALSIDQSNVEERNAHVKIMGEIFAKASVVHIWLGEGYGLEEKAVYGLDTVEEVIQEYWDFKTQPRPDWWNVQKAFFNHNKIKSLDWDAITELLSRAWFERVWCIQEIANAHTALLWVGNLCMAWPILGAQMEALLSFHLDTYIPQTEVQTIILMKWLRNDQTIKTEGKDPYGLLSLLQLTRNFKSTLLSDKIYGIINLAKNDMGLPIDYSIEPAQLYKQVALKCMKGKGTGGPLDILYSCMLSYDPPTLELPSWVPDWSRRTHCHSLYNSELNSSASGKRDFVASICEEHDMLHITGRLVDRISVIDQVRTIPPVTFKSPLKTGPPKARLMMSDIHWRYRDTEKQYLRTVEESRNNIRDWLENVLSIVQSCGEDTTERHEGLWRTFMCNNNIDGSTPDSSVAIGFDIWLEAALQKITPDELIRAREAEALKESTNGFFDAEVFAKQHEAVANFEVSHSKWAYNRRFFKTEKGRIGWTVNGTKVGDEVVVLYGLHTPFVLRQVGEPYVYTIVGDCYVHGIMNGEALSASFPEIQFNLV